MDDIMNGLLDIGYNGYFTFEVINIFTAASKKREYAKDTRLASATLEMRDAFEKSKNIIFAENTVKIMSALDERSSKELEALAEELCK